MTIQNNTVKNETITATYTYSSVDNPVESDTDTVEPVAVKGVTLDKTTASLKIGETVKLNATVSPSDADDKSVTWTSSRDAVAKVSSDGTVTAVAEGEATITVKTNDGGFTAECIVTVAGDDTEVVTDSDTATDTTTDTATDTTDTTTDSETTTDTTTDTDTDSETQTGDLLGDVDGNGKVELKDAYILQSVAIGKTTLTDTQFKKADVNHDGKITLKDASMVQQASVGLITLS